MTDDNVLIDDIINNVVPVVPAVGNTIPPRKQVSPALKWCFTLYSSNSSILLDFSVDLFVVKILSHPLLNKYAFQEEICPNTGRHHLQGWISFHKKIRPKTHFEPEYSQIHLAAQKAKKDGQAYRYVFKDDTAVPGTRRSNFAFPIPPRKIKSDLDGVTLYPWQKELYDLYDTEPDRRKVYWYWEPNGNAGKSAFIRHMCIKHPERVLSVTGKGVDIKFAFMKFIEKNEDCRMVFYDLCRVQEDHISYQSIEELKNGILFSSKYESCGLTFERPHVIVFANIEPDRSKLSEDRWVIKRLNELVF